MDAELGAKPQTLAMNLIASVVVPVLLLFHLVGPMPTDLGDHDGRLSPCSSPAHCAQEQWNSAEPNADFETLALRVEEADEITSPGVLLLVLQCEVGQTANSSPAVCRLPSAACRLLSRTRLVRLVSYE